MVRAGFSSSIFARLKSSFSRPLSLVIWFFMLTVHWFGSDTISRTSVFAEIMASGVFISCPASVMNCFCFSKLSTTGLMARFEKIMISRHTSIYPAAPIAHDTSKKRFLVVLSLRQSMKTIILPLSVSPVL